MKTVIDGLLYDTAAATEISGWSNGTPKNDFGFVRETLYKTDSGRYFLYGHGGAQTRYAKPAGDLKRPGKDIVPISEDEAFEWMQYRDIKPRRIQEEFPERVEPA